MLAFIGIRQGITLRFEMTAALSISRSPTLVPIHVLNPLTRSGKVM